jgi:signal transduction histidine kinase
MRRAAIVAAALVVATILTLALRPYITTAIFVFYYAAVVVAALNAGFAAGIVTGVLGATLSNVLVLQVGGNQASVGGTIAFLGMSTMLSVIADAARRTRATAESHAARLQDQTRELQAQREESQSLAEELEQSNVELESAMEEAELARDDAVASQDRLRLLDESSRMLATSLDYETTVAAAARMAVPQFADWAAVDILVGGDIKQLALVHADPAKVKWARELNARFRTPPDATTGVPHVIRTGQPQLFPRITDEMLTAAALTDEHLAILRSLSIHSAMVVPIATRGTTLGALTLVSSRDDLEYDESWITLAQQLAHRAAMAIDNARLYRAALAANEAKANFLATMSHELRTPLTAIIGYEELLAEGISGTVNDMQRQQLQRIKVSAMHLLSLIDEILLYARVEAGRESVRIEPVVAKGVVDDALSFVTPAADERGLVLRCEPIDPALMLRTDVGKLRQMLLNLLANAVKFTTRGEVVVRIIERDDELAFEVRDTGIGIDREDIDHIFETFWQVEQTTTRKAGGSGLGLSVTRRLARLLGGDVTVASTPFVGSTFTIVLPREPVSPLESRSV